MSNNTKSRFTCSNCKTSLTNSPKISSNKPTKDFEKSMEKNIEELMKSVSFISDQFDTFNKKKLTILPIIIFNYKMNKL